MGHLQAACHMVEANLQNLFISQNITEKLCLLSPHELLENRRFTAEWERPPNELLGQGEGLWCCLPADTISGGEVPVPAAMSFIVWQKRPGIWLRVTTPRAQRTASALQGTRQPSWRVTGVQTSLHSKARDKSSHTAEAVSLTISLIT